MGGLFDETRLLVHVVNADPCALDVLLAWGTASAQDRCREVLFTERFGPNGPGPWVHEEVAARDARYKRVAVWMGGDLVATELVDLVGRQEDGPDLLTAGPLDAEAQAAHDRLAAATDAFRSGP